MTVSCYFEPWK